MATGQNTLMASKRNIIKAIRNFRQKYHHFKWKLWKYQDAEEEYFVERDMKMADYCHKQVVAYTKAYRAAERMLASLEMKLANMQ